MDLRRNVSDILLLLLLLLLLCVCVRLFCCAEAIIEGRGTLKKERRRKERHLLFDLCNIHA